MENEKNKSVRISVGGNVNNSQVVASSGNVNINLNETNTSPNVIREAFQIVYQKIEERDATLDVDKSEISSTVQNIESEISSGDQVNTARIERWLKFLGEMAPDILDVVIKTLTNPILGIGETVRKIANKATK